MRRTLHGMTLLEVMVAMAIMAMSLTALLEAQGGSVALSLKATRIDTATMLARSKMEEIETKAEKLGINKIPENDEGEFDKELFPDYKWKYKTSKVFLPLMPGQQRGQFASMARNFMEKAIRRLTVTVTWKEGRSEKNIDLSTYLVDLSYLPSMAVSLPQGAIPAGGGGSGE